MRTTHARAGAVAGALTSLSLTAAAAAPNAALAQVAARVPGPSAPVPAPSSSGRAPASERPRPPRAVLRVGLRRLHVVVGGRVSVRGTVRAGGAAASRASVALQVRRGSGWSTLARERTRRGRYSLADRRTRTGSAKVRLRVSGAGLRPRVRSLGRLEVYRRANASWYGPGLYGNRLGCGGTLGTGTLGVAHKSLPCGTQVTFRRGGRSVRVRVIDRGPYVGGREYDLTAATAQRLGFRGHGPVLATR